MFSYFFYKILHLSGIFMTLMSISGLSMLALQSPGKTVAKNSKGRKMASIMHGVGLVLALVGGMGLLARIGVKHGEPFPLWVVAKLGIWLIFGALIAVILRKPKAAKVVWIGAWILGVLAAYIAVYKPLA